MLTLAGAIIAVAGACAHKSQISFPPADNLFVTTGDGDITKPYTPVGHLIFIKTGFRIPLPILGLIPLDDVDPEVLLRTEILEEVRRMGGDALINTSFDFTPPNPGLFGFMANGGSLAIQGTVIQQ